MKKIVKNELEELIRRYPQLDVCKKDIEKAYLLLQKTYDKNGKLLTPTVSYGTIGIYGTFGDSLR